MPPADARALGAISADARSVARAMALLWTWRPRTGVYELLRQLGARVATGGLFTQDAVKAAQQELRRAGLVVDEGNRQGYVRLEDGARLALYRECLAERPVGELRDALHRAVNFKAATGAYYGWPLWDHSATVAVVRLELAAGIDAAAFNALRQRIGGVHDWNTVIEAACYQPFDPMLFQQMAPPLCWELVHVATHALCALWRAEVAPVYRWALPRVESAPTSVPGHLRLQLAEVLVHSGEAQRAEALLGDDRGGTATALRACLLVQAGRWAEAQAGFEAAIKLRQAETKARKRVLPDTIAWLYPLSLIGQPATAAFELARKFCRGESGSRSPSPWDNWGLWVHAIDARLGDAALDPGVLNLRSVQERYIDRSDLWRCVLRAWLGAEACTAPSSPREREHADASRALAVAAIRSRLQRCGFAWLDSQVVAAEASFADRPVDVPFVVAGRQERWREALSMLAALGDSGGVDATAPSKRLVWALSLDREGGIAAITPMEQRRGLRGWNKPKPIGFARLSGNAALDPRDAKVMQAVRKDRDYARQYTLDRAAAIGALIGHPAVVMDDALDVLVDVVEGAPELEVVREGDRFVMRMTPPLRRNPGPDPDPDLDDFRDFADEADRREQEALRWITVQRDSPQRLRVIRLSPAQRRAAQLIADRLVVPAAAETDVQRALQSLAGHFRIESDHAAAAREIEPESRLRAEIAPTGESLALRLVVAPLGPNGPRLAPGVGRARVMAAQDGATVGTTRSLAAERAHLDAVLRALPFLAPPGRHDVVCEWVIDDPEDALAMVEALPGLPAVAAVDWPRGQAVRVVTVDAPRVAVQVRTERDWFALRGSVAVDEGRVLELQALLEAATGSRFIPMGDGVYAALTRDLQQRLSELAVVADDGRGELRVPRLAGAWLDEVLNGVAASVDAGFRERVDRLRAAQATQPALPRGLQAELRPYQEEGYLWAMRLAQAGFGACLADDMGLGKTIQALAVLAARAGGGPALVIAPTSVCGNWIAETQRFAPTLDATLYGEGDRAERIASAGPQDVLVVSWTQLQQAQQSFTSRRWHTVVADEAQAVKNAAAKRSLALFELDADFRMALSGTPVENRLSELWSIMRYCNPGLLGTLTRFNERFAGPIERQRDREAQRLLRRLIAPFLLRRTKAEVLPDLPARTELVVAVSPDAAEATHYEALRRQAVTVAEAAAGERGAQAQLNILAQLTRLRRAACDPRLVSPEFAIAGAKLRTFTELAEELVANGHKALVFSQFVDFLTLLREPLDRAGIRYQYLDGSTPAGERSRRVAAFQAGEGDLFLISLKAGGFGLNLTAADYVVITDPWWNPAAEDQAMGRAHRIGQQRPVTVYRLVAKGTLEEGIVALHHEKRALAEGVLAEGGGGAAVPTTDELIALLRGG